MNRTLLGACCLLFFANTPAGAGAKDDLNRAMKQFNRDICHTFELTGCKAAPSKRQKPVSATRKPAAAPEKAKPTATRLAPAQVPVPRQKPPHNSSAPKSGTKAETTASATPAADPDIPVPRAKPIIPANKPAGESRDATVIPNKPALDTIAAPSVAADPGCQQRLSQLAVTFTPQPTLASTGTCTLTDPVRLSSVAVDGGKIVFPDQPVLNCAYAEIFVKWITEKAEPIVRRETQSGLSILYTGPGYECRGRNGDGSAKLSEHGYGNAVDITQFKLKDGRIFQVGDALNPVSPAYATLRSMRFTACERFSTVLGPGTNAAHASHFHFDNGRHGKTGTYRICE